MKAIICEQYGSPDTLRLIQQSKPFYADNEVLIKIYATTVTSADCRIRALKTPFGFKFIMRLIFGFLKPKQPILGSELSGRVVAIGKDVTRFTIGDYVFAFTDMKLGCYVEYISLRENSLIVKKPMNLNFQEAAAISFGGSAAYYFLKKANIKKGEKILINGASGSVGTAMIQLAKYFGAEVTSVCCSANIDLVKSLGSNHSIDYTKNDFTQNAQTYDIIVDTVGNASYSRIKESLNDCGHFIHMQPRLIDMLMAPLMAILSGKKVIATPALATIDDLSFLGQLADMGLFKPVIDRCYPFEAIAEAHHYVDGGHKRGNVIISLE